MRGGGTSQSGQTIGDGLVVDTSKYLNRDPRAERRRALGARRAGHRARRAERRAAPARAALRARRLHRQPRHGRRHDGQQLERRALGALRQDHRPRARAGRGAVRRLAGALRPARRRRGRAARRRCRRSRARAIASCARGPRAGRRDRAPLSRRCCAASAATTSTSSWTRRGRSTWPSCWSAPRARSASCSRAKVNLVPLPQGQGGAGHPVSRPPRVAGRHAAHPHATGRRRSR